MEIKHSLWLQLCYMFAMIFFITIKWRFLFSERKKYIWLIFLFLWDISGTYQVYEFLLLLFWMNCQKLFLSIFYTIFYIMDCLSSSADKDRSNHVNFLMSLLIYFSFVICFKVFQALLKLIPSYFNPNCNQNDFVIFLSLISLTLTPSYAPINQCLIRPLL